MAGRKSNMGPMWAAMKAEGLDLEPSVPLSQNVYPGCDRREVLPDRVLIGEKLETFRRLCYGGSSGKAQGDLEPLQEPVTQTSAEKSKKKHAKMQNSQHLPAIPLENGQSGQARASASRPDPQVQAYLYEMRGHVQQAVDKYLELSGKAREQLSKVPTPCIDDHFIPVEEFQIKGILSPVAARIVLKALCTARLARLD